MNEWDEFQRADDWNEFDAAPPESQAIQVQPKRKLGLTRDEGAATTIGETALGLGTGIVATPIAGIAGLGRLARGEGLDEAVDAYEFWQNQLTYAPKSQGGQMALGAISAPFQWIEEGTDWAGGKVTDWTGSPAAGTATKVGLNFLPQLIGRGLKLKQQVQAARELRRAGAQVPRVEPGAAEAVSPPRGRMPVEMPPEAQAGVPLQSIRNPANQVRMETWKEANKAGYKFPPTQIEGSFGRGRLESIAGKAALKQDVTLHNQAITNDLARKAASLKATEMLDEGSLAAARERLAQPYRDIAKVSATARSALDELKTARADAKAQWQYYNRSGHPDALKAARQLDAEAATYEMIIQEEAIAKGMPNLVKQLKEARAKIAQNWDVDRALNVGTGDVDARMLARMLDQRGTQGMSGELLTIAKTAKAFGPFMGEASKVPTPGVSALEPVTMALGGMAGKSAGLGWFPAGLPLLSGPARAVAKSGMMQRPLSGGGMRGLGVKLSDFAGKNPMVWNVVPAIGLQPPQEAD